MWESECTVREVEEVKVAWETLVTLLYPTPLTASSLGGSGEI